MRGELADVLRDTQEHTCGTWMVSHLHKHLHQHVRVQGLQLPRQIRGRLLALAGGPMSTSTRTEVRA